MAPRNGTLAKALWESLGEDIKAGLAETAKQAVAEAISSIQSAGLKITWQTPEGKELAKLDGAQHIMTKTVVELILAGFRNILLVGPGGSGKSTIPRMVAKALGFAHGEQSFTEGTSETALTGRVIPNLQTGDETWHVSKFLEHYQQPSVFCLDEIDRANPNAVCIMNEALSNGHWYGPAGPVERHSDAVVVATANTYGQGADRMYVGANQLDAAFLDRFAGAIIDVDYDDVLEKAIATSVKDGTVTDEIMEFVQKIRAQLKALKLRRLFSTRSLVAVCRHVASGLDVPSAVNRCLVGWTDDEKTKVLA